MKRILIFAMLVLGAAACGPRDGIKTLRITEDVIADFGTIKEIKGPVTYRLVIKNHFRDTLFPVEVYTPCGCTTVDFDNRAAILPGEDEVLTVKYNPAYRPGTFTEEIQVYYRHSPIAFRSFLIKGNVIGYNHPIEEDRPYHLGEGLYVGPKTIAFGDMNPGETHDVFFRYGNGNKKKADIQFQIPDSLKQYLRMRQPGVMKADQRDTIHAKFTMPEGVERLEVPIPATVNGKLTEDGIILIARRRPQAD
ncbi:MAG: DUF1573 domain-containing protein [Bacteroidales bacterium]|nr:DUF1573 domain-containing protein [Bacteroidales bacterium]